MTFDGGIPAWGRTPEQEIEWLKRILSWLIDRMIEMEIQIATAAHTDIKVDALRINYDKTIVELNTKLDLLTANVQILEKQK